MQIRKYLNKELRAFALPAVLVITTGMLILLVALMTIVELERRSSKARLGSYQADLAVESGLEEAKMILASATASDTFAVGVIPFAAEFDDNGDGSISSDEDDVLDIEGGERGRPYLYAIQGSSDGTDPSFRLTPLFATHNGPGSERVTTAGELTLPSDPGVALQSENNLDNRIAVRGAEHLQAPVTAWRIIRDQEGVPLARYSYWVEDMQGYLDAEYVPGNARSGRHARANEVWQGPQLWNTELQPTLASYLTGGGQIPLWPAPGISPGYVEEAEGFLTPQNRLLAEAATYVVDQNNQGVTDQSRLDDTMRSLGSQAPTPASLIGLSGAQAPLERVAAGPDRGRLELRGADALEPRWIEENFVTGNRAWEEQALVPYVPGLDIDIMGAPRLNLNRLLTTASAPSFGGISFGTDSAISEMASFIQRALPEFASERRGGFGAWGNGGDQLYLQTLAASALDYADTDSTPKVKEGGYRGIDSHPFISEYVISTLHSDFDRSDGQNLFLVTEVEVFAELWNMSNQPITGNFELGYENTYFFEALANPEVEFMSPLATQVRSGSESFSTHNLERQSDGHWYSIPQEVTIPANGYTLVSTGTVEYHSYVGDASDFLPMPVEFQLPVDEPMDFRLRWNGVLCDRSGAGIEIIQELTDFRERSNHAVIPGTWGAFTDEFYSGMYDPRQSWWAGLANEFGVVSENSYPGNYSPGRRNVRYDTIAKNNPKTLHGRLLVSGWPDGGHDSSFQLSTFHKRGRNGNDHLAPDDPSLYSADVYSPEDSLKAPSFLSNLGRFMSETELGNVFDPIMWRLSSSPSRTAEIWFHSSLSDQNEEADVRIVGQEFEENETGDGPFCVPSQVVGGGNTLRIGRPEHSAFRLPGLRASHLLDLFHCGVPLSTDANQRIGNVRRVEGHVNVNTAPRDVLRALLAGPLVTDTSMGRELSSYDTRDTIAPRFIASEPEEISSTDSLNGTSDNPDEAGAIADAIIAARPFVSRSQLADLRYPEEFENTRLAGKLVFGNKNNHQLRTNLQRSDRAAEEVFGRIYNSTTTRSRNYRVHVIGQSLEQTPSGNLRVKATRKKSYRVFADAGARGLGGALEKDNVKIETLYETNL